MSDSIIPRDAQFFYQYAGSSYPTRAAKPEQEDSRRRNAERLAISHQLLAEAVEAGVAIVHWDVDEVYDPDVDYETTEVMCCAIEVDGDFVAALAGIQFERYGVVGRDPYCDVVEAELALEAHMELNEALAAALEEQLRAND
jgi:hypothetical protein